MKLARKSFLASLLVFLLIFVAAVGIADASKIDVNLEQKIEETDDGEMLDVLIKLKESPTLFNSMDNEEAVQSMKSNASNSQEVFLNKLKKEDLEINNQFWIVNVISAKMEKELISEVAKMDEVGKIYSSFELRAPEPEKEVAANQSWEHVESTKALEFWDEGYRGQDITVAVLDTGIDADHAEFNGELSYWAEFDDAGNIIEDDPEEAYDSDEHGSHTSGTVYGRNVGQYNIGMAPEATMAHGLVLPAGGGSFEQVAAGMEWSADNGFDIVNMSLGGAGQHDIMREAADNLWNSGVFLAASIGNDGEGNTGAPGNTPNATGVGAYGSNGDIAYFSGGGIVEYPDFDYDENSKIKPDISAPGDVIYSVQPGGGYQNMSGTSMSSPHLAGAAALIKSANPEMSVQELKEIIYNSVGGHDDLGWSDESEEKDIRFGWGRINVVKALEYLDVVEGPESNVKGVITSDEPNKKIEGVRVEFDGPVNKVVETDENGRYEVELVEGYYDVKLSRLGYEDKIDEGQQVVGEDDDYEFNYRLTPRPEGTIEGKIVDSTTGELISDATAKILAPEEEDIEVNNGEFDVSVMEEYYEIEANSEGYNATNVSNIRVAPGQTTQVEFELIFGKDNVTINLTEEESGDPLENAEIYVEETEESYNTDDSGEAILSLTAGEYNLSITKPGYLDIEKDLTVENGKVDNLAIEMVKHAGHVQGEVVDTDGDPVEGAEIRVADYDMNTTTDSNGEYILENVVPGNRILMVSKDGYWEQQATVEVEHDNTVTQDFTIESMNAALLLDETFANDNFDEVWETVNHGTTGQEWHRTDSRSLFGDYSAWHGDPATGEYPSNQSAEMVMRDYIDLPVDGIIEFSTYMWPEIEASFDVFSIFVEFEDGSRETLFEYDGNDQEWFEVFGDLSPLGGMRVKFGFAFESDFITNYEGVYIDGLSLIHVEDKDYGSINGTVTSEDGTAIEGATVTIVEDVDGNENKIKKTSQTVTDENGEYTIDVPAGGWTVEVDKSPDYHKESETGVYVEPGEEAIADFELEENLPPAKVENLSVVAEGHEFVEIEWDAVNEGDFDHYKVYRSIDGENYNELVTTEDTSFKAEGLQNGYTYYFKVTALDDLGQESELSEAVEGSPTNEMPVISDFNVSPRSTYRGAPVEVSAVLDDPAGTEMDLTLKAMVEDDTVREWLFEDIAEGDFDTSVETKDENGDPLNATFHDFVLEAVNDEGKSGVSEPVKVLLMSPLPDSLSFLVANNPFNPNEESQRMDYTVPAKGDIRVEVYTMDNKLVKTIAEGTREAGRHSVYWDGRNDKNEMVLNGAYIVKVKYTDSSGNTTVINKHSVVMK